ncbi:MAG: GtrA family protein [Solirubrobacteraceae bacterium]
MASGEQIQTVDGERLREPGVALPPDPLEFWPGWGPGWAEVRRQGFRFALVGGIVAGIYIGTTSLLAEVIGLPFEVSLAIGFALAIATHFNLQRLYVWRHAEAFALPVHHQLTRYLAMAGIQYGLTAAITGIVPHALGISPELVYLPTVAVITVTNFLIFRSRIFHAAANTVDQ